MIWAPLLVALVYGVLYSMMRQGDFNFTSPMDPYYFSFTTMSSVGYGDIVPKTDRAKLLVMTQQAIVAIGIFTLIENYVRLK
jgi:voltage-gated potassium channel